MLKEAHYGWGMGFVGMGYKRRLQEKAGAKVRNLNLHFWATGAFERRV